MKSIKEEDLLAELFADLKGPKKKRDNWISIAEKCRTVIQMYGSIERAAEKLDISYELLRSITTLLTLPEEVKDLIRKGEILYDAAQRLYRIRDPGKQIEVASVIAGLTSHKQREIIQYATRYPNSNLEKFKIRVVKPDKKHEKLHIAIIPLSQETYATLNKHGKQKGTSLERTILNILNEWIEMRSNT